MRSFDHAILDGAAKMIFEASQKAGALVSGPVPMPVKIKKLTLNKSTFKHKDAREQFEIRTHKRLIDLEEATAEAIDGLKNLSLPAGVEVEVKMF